MALKFAMILEAVDRMSRPAKRAKEGADKLVKSARNLAREGGPAARAMDRVSKAVGRVRASVGPTLLRLRALAGRAGLKGLQVAAMGAASAVGKLVGTVAGLAIRLAQISVATAAIAAGSLFGGAIRMGSTFEDLELRLVRLGVSAADAKRELRWLVDQRLPVPIEQLGEAFVQARKAGIDMTTDSLRALVDESIESKKELTDLVEAIKDAKNGAFGALEPFDIKATRKGGRVILQWIDKTGQRMTKNVRDSAREIERALVGVFGQRSKGAAADYGRTLKGMWQSIGLWWQRFQLKIADAGIYDTIKEKMQSVLDWLDARLADGSIDRWADNISTKLKDIVDWASRLVKETDWKKFGQELSDVAAAAWSLAKALADAVKWTTDLLGTREKAARNGSTVVVDGGPLFQIRRVNPDSPPPDPSPPKAKPASSGPASRVNLRGTPVNPRALRAPPAKLPGTQPAARTPAAPPQKVAVGGSLTIEVKAAQGLTATPTRMSSANPALPLVYRGAANRGWG